MNTEIVRTLEEAFPEPWPVERVVQQLLELTEVARGASANEYISKLTEEMFNVVDAIVSGKLVGLTDAERDAVRERFQDFVSDRVSEHEDSITADLSPEEMVEYRKTGTVPRY